MAGNVGQTFLERAAPPGGRFSVRASPLPRRPPPLANELLSSWIKRLARTNYCTKEELCRYLGLSLDRAPEALVGFAGIDAARLCSILRLARDDLIAMLIVEHHNFPIRCVAQEDFQQFLQCFARSPGARERGYRRNAPVKQPKLNAFTDQIDIWLAENDQLDDVNPSLSAFLLRQGWIYHRPKNWMMRYRRWLLRPSCATDRLARDGFG